MKYADIKKNRYYMISFTVKCPQQTTPVRKEATQCLPGAEGRGKER